MFIHSNCLESGVAAVAGYAGIVPENGLLGVTGGCAGSCCRVLGEGRSGKQSLLGVVIRRGEVLVAAVTEPVALGNGSIAVEACGAELGFRLDCCIDELDVYRAVYMQCSICNRCIVCGVNTSGAVARGYR